jgi:hypothetical protein
MFVESTGMTLSIDSEFTPSKLALSIVKKNYKLSV